MKKIRLKDVMNSLKGRKQEESEESWSKRNLFAIFVLIPLIIGLLSLSIWCMTYGINLSDIVPRVSFKSFTQEAFNYDVRFLSKYLGARR